MQQPMSQHDQLAAQQAQQQMVLCPVRLVYETQILVQPGDQIQPNQTLFINPQNPPPWAQNRQVQQQQQQQNPVIYVQQLSNNMMPTVQQQMDQQVQQHLYLQQFQNYQQIIPQQMIQSQQENRQNQIQIQNMIHQNMLGNFQTNIGQNIQIQDANRMIQQANFAQAQANQSIQMQNQAQIIANNNMTRQNEANMPNTVQMQPQNQMNQRVEVKQYQQANVGQINQPPNMVRTQPQVITVNPMQNVPQAINIQTFNPNVMNRPIKTENASSQVTMPTFVNAAQNTHITRIRKVAPAPIPNMNKMNTPVNVGIRNMSQPYRPIQPRPQQYRHHLPNYPVEQQIQNAQSMPLINQNINTSIPIAPPKNINQNIPVSQAIIPNIQIQPPANQTIVKPEENSRKRKSESPDEIHKKMAAIQVNSQVPTKQITVVQSSIGTNTSPVHKKTEKLSMPLLFSNENPPEAKNMVTLIQNVQNAIKVDKVNMIKPNEEPKEPLTNMTDQEKLVRNTVFNQARGRIFTDKELHNAPVTNEITITLKEEKPQLNDTIKAEPDKLFKIPNPVTIEKPPEAVKTEIDKTDKPFKITNEVKSEKDEDGKKVETKETEMNVSLNTTNNKGMFPMEKCEQEKDFILTHVLDGIVIQESNVAFPIREPLTRRVIQPSTSNDKKTRKSKSKEIKEKTQKEEKIEPTPVVKTDDEEKTKEGVLQGDPVPISPFSNITQATVKSWTTSELSAHLAKNQWQETAALFQDHEIDGESLFLVSKTQLQNIGVKEEQADVICAFVKS